MIEVFHSQTHIRILDNLPLGIFILRKDNHVLFWNRTLEYWTGLQSDEAVGKDVCELYPHLCHKVYQSRLGPIFDGGPPSLLSSKLHTHIIPAKLPGGMGRVQQTIISAIPADNPGEFYALFAIQDVSELTNRITTTIRLSKNLEKLNRLKDEFISILSHDLKSPVNTIITAVSTLSQGYVGLVNDKQLELSDLIKRNAKWLLAMIQDLLDLSRIESGALVDSMQPGDLCFCLTRVLNNFNENNICIDLPHEPVMSNIDSNKIDQAIQNLISNAVRFAKSKVSLALKVEGKNAIITVTDDGIGIPEKDLDRIFHRYARVKSHGDKSQTGVGLAIVKAIVEAHGGKAFAENVHAEQEVVGARFTMNIPLISTTSETD